MQTNYKIVLGRTLTTVATGGEVKLLEINDTQDLKFLPENYYVLGKGSNVIIPDAGLTIPVIQLGRGFRYLKEVSENIFEVGGTYSVMALSRDLSNRGFTGLEFAGGIPASIGGAIKMNAGAHYGEFSNIVEEVSVFRDREIISLDKKDLEFSYRHSNFRVNDIILSVKLKLASGDAESISSKFKSNLDYRKNTQPLTTPSFGSVFKNPPSHSAGALIEQAGLKGFQIGEAEISSLHGNWIINPRKNAKSSDLLKLIEKCQESVLNQFQIELIPEVQIWK